MRTLYRNSADTLTSPVMPPALSEPTLGEDRSRNDRTPDITTFQPVTAEVTANPRTKQHDLLEENSHDRLI
jgi:hypothetical protein